MRQNYNSFEYWKSLINENKTIRGHMLMNQAPTEKSVYMHTLIFCKENGLNNIWSYFPDVQSLIGYVRYSFLQEAFYIWINCRGASVAYVPLKPVEEIIKNGEKSKKITRREAEEMMNCVKALNRLWELPNNKLMPELKRFTRAFNRMWSGDSREFLYLKIFETPEELGNFVVESSYMSTSDEEFRKRTSENMDTWNDICKNAIKNKEHGEKFRKILQRNLTEVI